MAEPDDTEASEEDQAATVEDEYKPICLSAWEA